MIPTAFDRVAGFVTRHNRVTILVMLALTGVMFVGMGMIETGDPSEDDMAFNETEIGQGLEYIQDHYNADEELNATEAVYVRPDGNALSQESMSRSLAYLEEVMANESVADNLVGRGVHGPPTLLGQAVAGPDATFGEQREAIERLDAEAYETQVSTLFGNADLARVYLPADYEPGEATADSMRLLFEFDEYTVDQEGMPVPDPAAERALYEAAEDDETILTLDQWASAEWADAQFSDTIWLILPAALLLVLSALAIAYRDIVDVLIGFFGVLVSLVWFFGIVGWLQIPADFSLIVGPVLIVALSIDFGLHVFMRYREQRAHTTSRQADRDADPIRAPMRRATASVGVAFLLVAITAGIGFGSNVTSPFTVIQQFGVAITLGVFAAFVIFVTLVPALKVSADGLLERVGFSREKRALGTAGILASVLSGGVTAARRGALAVIVVAVLAGVAGGLAYTDLDREAFQHEFIDDDDWQTDLPSPLGWESHEHEYQQLLTEVNEQYQSPREAQRETSFLIRGDVTSGDALDQVALAEQRAGDYESVFSQRGVVAVTSPLTVMDEVAASNETFATTYHAYDPRNETLTEEEVTALYDALYSADPAAASEVIERTDGEYRSLLVQVPVTNGVDTTQTDEEMHALATDIEGDTELSVLPIGTATLSTAELGAIADSILEALLLALVGVLVTLAVVFRAVHNSATLGAITVVPIALVMGLVFGGMYLLSVPLTFLTAFLVAITIGLGIDYTIHITDRFAQEREAGRDSVDALYTTVRGTGGALFGSALTSGAAFSTIALHPHPQFTSLGLIVVLALTMSFLVSVFVLPSLLYRWAQWRADPQETGTTDAVPTDD